MERVSALHHRMFSIELLWVDIRVIHKGVSWEFHHSSFQDQNLHFFVDLLRWSLYYVALDCPKFAILLLQFPSARITMVCCHRIRSHGLVLKLALF